MPIQQPTVLFSIYQNNSWTIRCLVDETIDPATQRNILRIVGFLVFIQFTVQSWHSHVKSFSRWFIYSQLLWHLSSSKIPNCTTECVEWLSFSLYKNQISCPAVVKKLHSYSNRSSLMKNVDICKWQGQIPLLFRKKSLKTKYVCT